MPSSIFVDNSVSKLIFMDPRYLLRKFWDNAPTVSGFYLPVVVKQVNHFFQKIENGVSYWYY